MAFKLLVRHPDKGFVGALEPLLEDTAYILCVPPDTIDWQDSDSIIKSFSSSPPKIVVYLLPEDLKAIDDNFLREQQALVEVCSSKNIPFVQISSYRVFGDVWVERGWRESDEPDPTDALGKVILQLEKNASQVKRHIILRAGWLLEGQGGLLESIILPMLDNESLVVSDRRYGSPLSQKYIARAVLAMAQQIIFGADNWGVFHLHSSDRCSEAEIADHLQRLLANEFKLNPTQPSVTLPGDDRYLLPGCAHLLGRRCTANFGIQLPTWRTGFARTVKSWLDEVTQGQDETTKQQKGPG